MTCELSVAVRPATGIHVTAVRDGRLMPDGQGEAIVVLKVSRRGQVPPFIVMDVMQAAADREATGADVLHLEVGQPATAAPRG